MKTIWKFQLTESDEQFIDMPEGALPLSVDVQNGIPCLWALVNPDNNPVAVHVKTFGTGNPIATKDDLDFIGTYQMYGGQLVWHVFKVQS